jgi:hypothetical protein
LQISKAFVSYSGVAGRCGMLCPGWRNKESSNRVRRIGLTEEFTISPTIENRR